jgi:hypothetical protein
MDENPSSDAQRCIRVEVLVLNAFDALRVNSVRDFAECFYV